MPHQVLETLADVRLTYLVWPVRPLQLVVVEPGPKNLSLDWTDVTAEKMRLASRAGNLVAKETMRAAPVLASTRSPHQAQRQILVLRQYWGATSLKELRSLPWPLSLYSNGLVSVKRQSTRV